MILFEEANAIVRQEASRRGVRYDTVEDRRQDGWVILLENDPPHPALARTIIRRRLINRDRDSRTRKRGAGFAIGRLDAGWDEEIGFCPEEQLVQDIAQAQLLKVLNFQTLGGSRQAVHQAITRAKRRWEKTRRTHD